MAISLTAEPTTVELLVPVGDEPDPEVTILVPALNEELTVSDFVGWCHEGLRKAGVKGEIIIVDSSTDATPRIALEQGARVLRVPRRGLGRAYRDGIPFVRGRFVIMGDADCTYDFRELRPFLDALRAGNEFVMGSRFKGTIEPGSMPWHHRYLGTPVTTMMLNVLFHTRFSDIHCGMRAATREALVAINLQSDGWEYASEMILNALHLELRATEVPIHFHKDRNGRISNVKRAGPLTSWKAGWNTLRVMFVNGADFFLFMPGIALALLGVIGTVSLATGPRTLGPVTFTLHAQSMFLTAGAVGLLSVYMGVIARCIYDPTSITAHRWRSRLPFNRVAAVAGLLGVSGLGLDAAFFVSYVQHGYAVTASMRTMSHLAITGLLLVTAAFIVFACTLVLHALAQLKTPTVSASAIDLTKTAASAQL